MPAAGPDGAAVANSTGQQQSSHQTRQCPLDGCVRLYCPWHSPVCPLRTRARVLEIEDAARTALEASTHVPAWTLFGDADDLHLLRLETSKRRPRSVSDGNFFNASNTLLVDISPLREVQPR